MATTRKQLQNMPASALDVSSSLSALIVHAVDESGNYVSPGAGSTQLSVREILTSSGASVMDSTNNAIGVTIRAGSAGGTEYTDGDVDATISGQALLFDNSSNTLRPVTLTRGLPVNIVAGSAGSTVVTVSTGSVRVHQSTAADLNVTVAGYSTTANISSVAGVVRIAGNNAADGLVHVGDSTNNALRVNVVAGAAGGSTEVTVRQSTAADFQVTATQASTVWAVQLSNYSTTANISSLAGKVLVDQNSTVWNTQARLHTSSGGAIQGSTTAPAANVIGLHVRPVCPTLNSTTILITSTNSTAIYPLVSSAASPLRHKVCAYFVGSTHTNPSTLIFCSSASASGFDHWSVNFGSGSSGVTGANLAVSAPCFLFGGVANTALNVKVEGGSSAASTVVVRVSISWFDEA